MLNIILINFSLLTIFASFVVIIPLIVGIITIKSWKESSLKIVFTYCVIYALFELIAWYYVLNHRQNHFIHNIISYVDIIFWGYYFYSIIDSSLGRKVVITLSMLTIGTIIWSNLGINRDFNRVDSFAISISNLTLIAMSLLFFYQLLSSLVVKDLLRYPHFWISAGVLLYFSGVFFVHIFAEYITFNKDKTITHFWILKNYLLFFHRIFLAIGLWFSKTPPQLSPSSK
jgi:hypothetical protein